MSATRFIYHASAVGLSAQFSRPFQEPLDSQAVSALSPSGGYSGARREHIRIREFLTCARVSTETAGSYSPQKDSFDTFASAVAEGFNLAGIVKADHISTRISSSHPASGAEPSLTPLGSGFSKLTVAGQDIELESFVVHFTQLNTMTKLRDAYKNDAAFRKSMDETMMIGQKDQIAQQLHKFFPWCGRKPTGELPEIGGTAILPLFRVVNKSVAGFTVVGNVIHVENFGRVHIGEIIVSSYERRVTGLHVVLGSPVDGSTDVSYVGGNGTSTNDPP